ncbi:hypothetical protein SAMN05421507_115132 [Lentzea jiangxiensis]|uniref:Uncharacterized protein n=1 Tax=Lentzea jiangxiensis TaxID=641025 RepID=A0A1H0VT33_9PSEU|nr:hypothetical protein SAMN05421507_115132 [Lentzea jiangxiensis]
MLANWSAGDVQALVALVAPMFYLQGRSRAKGEV